MIGKRLCGENPPSIPMRASGSELHLTFYSSSLFLNYRTVEDEEELYRKLRGFRGFRIKIEAETGNDKLLIFEQ